MRGAGGAAAPPTTRRATRTDGAAASARADRADLAASLPALHHDATAAGQGMSRPAGARRRPRRPPRGSHGPSEPPPRLVRSLHLDACWLDDRPALLPAGPPCDVEEARRSPRANGQGTAASSVITRPWTPWSVGARPARPAPARTWCARSTSWSQHRPCPLDREWGPLLPSRRRSWGLSSAGRALESHSRGQGFDPPRLHQGTKRSRASEAFFVFGD